MCVYIYREQMCIYTNIVYMYILVLHICKRYTHKLWQMYNVYVNGYVYDATGLKFAGNPGNSMPDCNPLCCFGACFLQSAIIQNTHWFCLRLVALLHLPETVPQSPLGACLIDTGSCVICNSSIRYLKPQRLWKNTKIT